LTTINSGPKRIQLPEITKKPGIFRKILRSIGRTGRVADYILNQKFCRADEEYQTDGE
jgi:hypothetical protein